mmetsp:Transcript_16040/g.31362  ORF Transcript_16040/g.31362 Transcript_16040/m.31362 type:complete len:384 (-) Transcript_16040:75-1226(-)
MPRGQRRGRHSAGGSARGSAADETDLRQLQENHLGTNERGERLVIFSKTKMCKFYILGMCSKGSGCRFAHHKDELHALPDLSRTKLCKTLISSGICEDPNCRYAHNKEELRAVPDGVFFGNGSTPEGRCLRAAGRVAPSAASSHPASEASCPSAWPQLQPQHQAVFFQAATGSMGQVPFRRPTVPQEQPATVSLAALLSSPRSMSGQQANCGVVASSFSHAAAKNACLAKYADVKRDWEQRTSGDSAHSSTRVPAIPESDVNESNVVDETAAFNSQQSHATTNSQISYLAEPDPEQDVIAEVGHQDEVLQNSYGVYSRTTSGGFSRQMSDPIPEVPSVLESGDIIVKNTFLQFTEQEPMLPLRSVRTAAGRLDSMGSGDDSDA